MLGLGVRGLQRCERQDTIKAPINNLWAQFHGCGVALVRLGFENEL